MKDQQIQAIALVAISLSFMAIVYYLARKGRISFRFTIGWISLFMISSAGLLALPLTASVADKVGLTPAGLLAVLSTIFLLLICIQLTISISGMQERIRRLAEEVALMAHDLEKLKAETK